MIEPLKIVVCSLKLVKLLPGVQNNSPVVNTPGSLVMNTPWSLEHCGASTSLGWIYQGVDFLVCFEQASEQVYKETF